MRSGAPRVIEFNCRFGDPEAQAVLARLRSDLPALCLAALARRLHEVSASIGIRAPRSASCWPRPGIRARCRLGAPINGLDRAAQLPGKVFHAGTELRDGQVVTSGGRVLCAVGLGADVAQRSAPPMIWSIASASPERNFAMTSVTGPSRAVAEQRGAQQAPPRRRAFAALAHRGYRGFVIAARSP